MLFTPKKYDKETTFGLAVGFYVTSLGFGVITVIAIFSRFDDLSDKIFSVLGFFLMMLVWAALGRSHWKLASKMRIVDRRKSVNPSRP